MGEGVASTEVSTAVAWRVCDGTLPLGIQGSSIGKMYTLCPILTDEP